MNRVESRGDKTIAQALCIICFLTNISQMPMFVESQITRYISIPIWLVFAGICLLKNHFIIYIGYCKSILALCIFFASYYLIGQLFIRTYGDSALPYAIFLSVFIFMLGTMAGKHLNNDDLVNISTMYIWSGLVVCVNVFFSYIYGQSISGRSYLYTSKNSVSQILLTTWILIILLKFNKRGWAKKVFYCVAVAFLTFCMLALKSRATILGIPIIMIWVLLHGNLNKRARNMIVLVLAIFVILMLQEDIYDVIVNDVLFAGRDATNLNELSSGRTDEWATFWTDISGHEFFGQGRKKRESLVLTALLEFGFIGGGIVLIIALMPLIWSLNKMKKNDSMYLIFTSLAIVYFFNGIFEQLAPFGPGVKCYYLWLLMGILISSRSFKGGEKWIKRIE